MSKEKNFKTAYDAGYDAGRYGADTNNSHFTWFCDEQMMLNWNAGNKAGKLAQELDEKFKYLNIQKQP